MHDALLVRRLQRLRDLARNGERLVEWNGNLRDAVGEGRGLDQLHHERRRPGRPLEAVDGRDVWMVQRRKHFGLALEARQPLRVARDGLGQDLDRDLPLQARVGGSVDLAHPAHAEQGGDLISAEPGSWAERHQCVGL
jgi:hypothetical protein